MVEIILIVLFYHMSHHYIINLMLKWIKITYLKSDSEAKFTCEVEYQIWQGSRYSYTYGAVPTCNRHHAGWHCETNSDSTRGPCWTGNPANRRCQQKWNSLHFSKLAAFCERFTNHYWENLRDFVNFAN